MGLSIAASLIAPPPGSNVVVDELTHQSNVYPWMLRSQVELRYARSDGGRVALSEFEGLVDENTAAIDVCHVTMGHGFRHDLATLADLAHAHRAYLVVDAAQSAGVVPIDVGEASVDFLSCPTFKWLWGPLGAGFLYVRKDLLKLGPPPLVGWMSARRPAGFDIHSMHLHDDARRLQRGVHNGAGLVAALAGLRIVDELGADTIWHYVRGLSRQLLDGLEEVGLEVLTPTGDEERGGIVAFSVQDAANFNQALSDLDQKPLSAVRSVHATRFRKLHYTVGQARMNSLFEQIKLYGARRESQCALKLCANFTLSEIRKARVFGLTHVLGSLIEYQRRNPPVRTSCHFQRALYSSGIRVQLLLKPVWIERALPLNRGRVKQSRFSLPHPRGSNIGCRQAMIDTIYRCSG